VPGQASGICSTCFAHTLRSKAAITFHIKRNFPAFTKVRNTLLGKSKGLSRHMICFLGKAFHLGNSPHELSAIADAKDIGNALGKSQRDKWRAQYDVAYSAVKCWYIKQQGCGCQRGSIRPRSRSKVQCSYCIFFSYD